MNLYIKCIFYSINKLTSLDDECNYSNHAFSHTGRKFPMMMSWAAKSYRGAVRTFIKGSPAVGTLRVPSGGNRWKATLAAEAPGPEARPSRDIPGPKRWPGVASLPFVLSHKGLHLLLLRELKLNIVYYWIICCFVFLSCGDV